MVEIDEHEEAVHRCWLEADSISESGTRIELDETRKSGHNYLIIRYRKKTGMKDTAYQLYVDYKRFPNTNLDYTMATHLIDIIDRLNGYKDDPQDQQPEAIEKACQDLTKAYEDGISTAMRFVL